MTEILTHPSVPPVAVLPLPPEVPPKGGSTRMFVSETIYFQPEGRQPTSLEHRDSYTLDVIDPRVRSHEGTADAEWSVLSPYEAGSVVHIHNTSQSDWQRVPTDEQRAEFQARTLEVGVEGRMVLDGKETRIVLETDVLPPGKAVRRLPPPGCMIVVRSDRQADYVATIYPR